MASTQVLVLGFDPTTIPGYDPAPVVAAIERGQQRFVEYGISCELGLLPFDDTSDDRIAALLRREPYACVVIGGGIRKEEDLLELFERVVNLVRVHAPQAAIAFNSRPDDGADAARRWLTGA